MPIWPFNRKRRAATVNDPATEPLTEKFQSAATTRRTSTDAPPPVVAGKMSAKSSVRRRNASQPQPVPPLDLDDAPALPPPLARPPMASNKSADKPKTGTSAEKENVRPRTHHSSVENITALPVSRRLESSPHLRAVDLERPVAAIPYSVRPYSKSQTSVQRADTVGSTGRPRTLRSKKSTNDAASIPRRQSTKKRRNDQVREEEIRAMSSTMPVPPRPGTVSDSPLLRKESTKKPRGASGKNSLVSLPPAESSIHSSTLSGVTEQRGWEIGMGAAFTPRPVVRLSGTPQYVSPSSAPGASSYITRELSRREEKAPASRSSGKKRQTVGNRVDDLDTAELRMILERDAKRKERKKVEQKENLDKKLRGRSGRNRGDSDRSQRRREAAEALERAHETNPMPTTLHPALRDHRAEEEAAFAAASAGMAGRELGGQTTTTTEARRFDSEPVPVENPFADPPVHEQLAVVTRTSDDMREAPAPLSLVATPMEEEEQPILGTAEAVSMSQPPISPVDSNTRTPQGFSPVDSPSDSRPVSELVPPHGAGGVIALDRKRASEPPREATSSSSTRRAAGGPGGWTSFFRRSTQRRPPNDESSEAGRSFSNTSRESMRGQPIPAHLIDTTATSQSATTTRSSSTVQRRRSETPVSRTQSRFREDLPESLQQGRELADSRIPSPDVTTAAALAAAARRSGNGSGIEGRGTQPIDIPSASSNTGVTSTPVTATAAGTGTAGTQRGDVPVSPTIRGHGMMSASLASIDSEGSWLAGGPGSAKRQSTQSGVGRNLSLRKQQQLLLQQQSGAGSAAGAGVSGLGLGSATSFEDLGGDVGAGGSVDRDAEYFQRVTAAGAGSSGAGSPGGAAVGESSSDQALLAHHQHQQQQMMLQRQLSLSSQQRRQQQLQQQQAQQESLSVTPGASEANALRLSSGTTGATSIEGVGDVTTPGSDRRESELLETAPPVLDSIVRRRPTLVHRTEPRVKSREGLLAEYSAEFGNSSAGPATPFDDDDEGGDKQIGGSGNVGGGVQPVDAPLDDLRTVSLQQLSGQPTTTTTTTTAATTANTPAYTTTAQRAQSYTADYDNDDLDDDTATTDIDDEEDADDSDMHRATSISYQRERGHVRQISAGSARLLDVSRVGGGGAGVGSVPRSPVDASSAAGTSAPVSPVDAGAGSGAGAHARTGSGAGLFSRGLEEILGRKDEEGGS